MKIISKFGLGFTLILALMGGYFATVTAFISQQREVSEVLNQRFLPSMAMFNLITNRMADFRSSMYAATLNRNLDQESLDVLKAKRVEALGTSVGELDEIIVLLELEEELLEKLGEFAGYYGEVDGYVSRTFRGFELRDYVFVSEVLLESEEAFQSLRTLGQEIILSLQTITQEEFRELEELSRSFNLLFLVLLIFLVVLSGFIFLGTTRSLHHRLKKFIALFSRGAGGDLTVRMPPGPRDELAPLEDNFNQFVSALQETLSKIQAISRKSAGAASNLSSHSEELQATMNLMTQMMTHTAAGGKDAEEKIGASFQKTVEIEGQSSEISQSLGRQNQAIQDSSTAVEAMASALNAMTSAIQERKSVSDRLAEKAKEGEQNMHRTLAAVEEISSTADKVVGLVRLIEDIAAKTNILALNAAIQAARAGVHGKSFAVVAEEIRKLSETTGRSAVDIFQSLQEIRDKITSTREVTHVTEASSQEIFAGMQEVSGGMGGILESVRTLAGEGTRIRDELSSLVTGSRAIHRAAQTISERTKEMEGLMSATLGVTKETSGAIAQTTSGVAEIGASTVYLRNQAMETQEQTRVLDGELSRFTLEPETPPVPEPR